MGKRIWIIVFAIVLLFSVPARVQAQTAQVRGSVSFTDPDKKTLDSSGTNLNAAVGALQPGDGLDISIDVVNGSNVAVNYYMTNEVVNSLEDTEGKDAEGGAYEYILSYQGPSDAEPRYLFRSTVLGGDGSEGLLAATEGLEDYIYLDTLAPGQSGVVKLWVALDGETQGNSYQGTAANLKFDFAVDTATNQVRDVVETEVVKETVEVVDNTQPGESKPGGSGTGMVKTGDDTNLPFYIGAAGVSGILLLVLALFSVRERKRQRRGGKTLGAFLALALALAVPAGTEAAQYTYTVRLYAGAQGILDSGVVVEIRDSVDRDVTGERTIEVAGDGSCVTVKGLLYDDKIIFDVATPVDGEGAVTLKENSEGVKKYYVRGLRESGADTSSHDETGVGFAGYRVVEDKDYVVAYGIRGDMTQYKVEYVDQSGNTLLPAKTYQGKAGDYVVAAYRYVEGFQPYAYNLGKTLSANEAENLFRFVYTALPVVENVTTQTVTEYVTVTVPGTSGDAPDVPSAVQGGQTPPAGEQTAPEGGQTPPEEGGIPPVNIPDENLPENGPTPPRDSVNLDDEKLPEAGPGGDGKQESSGDGKDDTGLEEDEESSGKDGRLSVAAKAGIVTAVILLAGAGLWIAWVLLRRRKKAGEDEKETGDGR